MEGEGKGKGKGKGEAEGGGDCIDDHAAIIHPLLLLVLFSTKKKFSHRNCVLLRTKPEEKKIGPRVEEDRNQ